MKRILNKLSIITAATVLLVACTKKIDLKPAFQLDGSSPLTTIAEADNVLTGAYDGFRNGDYYSGAGSGALSLVPDIMGDDLIESLESLGNFRVLAEWRYASNEPNIGSTWLNAYNIISSVNIILRDIDAIAAKDPKAAARIKGQALAIRAHVHFDLLRLFGESLDRNSTARGVPYVTTFDVTAKPSRSNVKESYDKILADLDLAYTTLSGELDKPISSSSNRTRIDAVAVKAMQARVNLYGGQWQAAADAATIVIAQRPLSNISTFPLIWTDETNAEVVWAVSFNSLQDGVPYDNVFFARGNRSTYRPAQGLTSLYNQANDVRYNSYVAQVGELNGISKPTRLIVIKHLGKAGATDGVVNWKVYRTAEMYLIRAEANFKLTKETDARNDLNTLRANRIAGFVPGGETGQVLLNAILTERRKELAFEGHRFFDLKRLNKTPIDRCASNTNTLSTVCSLPSNSRAWAWPIPFNETNVNTNIEPNDGY
jgi:hypothetical protein